jgi:protein-disulfide isomerase
MSTQLTLKVGERDHVLGSSVAAVTLVEYGDYECPYCGAAYPIVKSVARRLGSELRFVFRNFPLRDLHPHAELAAEAAEAAAAQGGFWQMHDTMFENQGDLSGAALVRYAASAVPDPRRWATDMHERRFNARVREDLASGERSGVRGTPTFFINGILHEAGYDEVSLLRGIEAALECRPSALDAS